MTAHIKSCCEHHTCGSLLSEDVTIHFRKLQILVDDEEQSAIAAYHVSGGIDFSVSSRLQALKSPTTWTAKNG